MQINLEQQDINAILIKHLEDKGLIPTGQTATFLYQNRRKNGGIQAQVIFNTITEFEYTTETAVAEPDVVEAPQPVAVTAEESATPKLF